jgi:hypothetical protein
VLYLDFLSARDYTRAIMDLSLHRSYKALPDHSFMKSDKTNERTMISVSTTKMIWLALGPFFFFFFDIVILIFNSDFPLAIFYNKPF